MPGTVVEQGGTFVSNKVRLDNTASDERNMHGNGEGDILDECQTTQKSDTVAVEVSSS
jgi:hypothetical protein